MSRQNQIITPSRKPKDKETAEALRILSKAIQQLEARITKLEQGA
tara:strand:- start:1431 stop:1565 length:135 start_codon:yes stop_codon:yes gene_type:complete